MKDMTIKIWIDDDIDLWTIDAEDRTGKRMCCECLSENEVKSFRIEDILDVLE